MKRTVSAIALLALALATGCSSYHYVKQTNEGGTIALEGDREAALEKATGAMQDHCSGDYTVISSGEELVPRSSSEFDMSREAGSGAMRDQYKHEYRVTYRCLAAR